MCSDWLINMFIQQKATDLFFLRGFTLTINLKKNKQSEKTVTLTAFAIAGNGFVTGHDVKFFVKEKLNQTKCREKNSKI